MTSSSGRYTVPPEILKHKPRGTMVKKIHGGFYVYAMENVKDHETGKWHTKTKGILGKITLENGYILAGLVFAVRIKHVTFSLFLIIYFRCR